MIEFWPNRVGSEAAAGPGWCAKSRCAHRRPKAAFKFSKCLSVIGKTPWLSKTSLECGLVQTSALWVKTGTALRSEVLLALLQRLARAMPRAIQP